ncbi:peptide/nickel transport system ATP-binding protein [Klenkia soli]|uniref:Peptide/nickel transport system ATP-binding protein n=1 Tax=Klenkia soli TaxID=1052260 RepID=A0A1H0CBQ0_9ACTN|nr:ABC transporter ATP-binding protein [Klenkia soli]SDN55266.1 peptide/nickel transport system ATP-binding protein [Klenkia soli]
MSDVGDDVSQVPLLSVRDLGVVFPGGEDGDVPAVRGVAYDLAPGEVLGIVGESGSGKSVSSLAVMGLLPRNARVTGSVRLRGVELLGRPDGELARIRGNDIAMVFQDPLSALTPVYTVGDQIAETIRIHQRLAAGPATQRAVELLDSVGIPNAAQRAKAFPHEFSGGMRQRVMIAMAIANDPDVLIADEPTTALDVTIQAQVLELLETARQLTNAATVMITHDLGVVAGIADRVLVMYAGKAVEQGPVGPVYAAPRMPYTIGLLGSVPRLDRPGQTLTPISGSPPNVSRLEPGCPFASRCPVVLPVCREVEPELTPTAVGSAACHRADEIVDGSIDGVPVFPPPVLAQARGLVARTERPAVLEVREVTKRFDITRGAVMRRKVGSVSAVDGVSFDIREGEALGLVGESGSGKTTTIMEVLSLQAPAEGSIVVHGKDVAGLGRRERKELRRDIQVVFQDPLSSLDPRLPVGDIIDEPLRSFDVPRAERAARVGELLRLVGLAPEHANRYPADFSGGQRQRIGIARALALEPKLLVLDEPVSALDVSIQAGVLNLLEDLKVRLGLAYLFVAHDLSVVRHIADRVAVMYLGRLVEVGDADDIFERPTHPYTQALLSAVPIPDPVAERQRERILVRGDLPDPANLPSGCRFRSRCPLFVELEPGQQQRCAEEDPALVEHVPGLASACHFARERTVVPG